MKSVQFSSPSNVQDMGNNKHSKTGQAMKIRGTKSFPYEKARTVQLRKKVNYPPG